MKLHNNLLPHEAKFALWLEESAPYLLQLWDFENGRYIRDRVDDYLFVCSTGQSMMCRFTQEVWPGGVGDFDFILFGLNRFVNFSH